MILTEGVDIPSIDCIVVARPTTSATLVQQIVGRGFRKAEGKKDCLLIDLAYERSSERSHQRRSSWHLW